MAHKTHYEHKKEEWEAASSLLKNVKKAEKHKKKILLDDFANTVYLVDKAKADKFIEKLKKNGVKIKRVL